MARKHIESFSEHLTRYVFAAEYCDDKVVLDAGSKEGFGAHIISYACKQVILADIRQDFLNDAKRWYGKMLCPIPPEHICIDFEKDFPNQQFDVIVALELLDHLETPLFFLQNSVNHLTPGGKFIFSL